MANNLRVFNTNSEYQSADLVLPSVSYVVETDKVIYDYTPPTPSFKWKATYSDSSVTSAECGSSSEIVRNEINKTNLVSVEIGDCVTSIGAAVFNGCSSLTSIEIPNSVTSIGDAAFYECSFTSINIPSGVTIINYGVFLHCNSLTSIDIPDSVTSIGDAAFNKCTSLTSCTIGSGVTSIGYITFNQCSSLTSIEIPNSVTSIGEFAFANCSGLTSCTIGSGVTSIGQSVFAYCRGLTSITVNAVTPPTLGEYVFDGSTCPILVPLESLTAYQTAWSQYAGRIQAIP